MGFNRVANPPGEWRLVSLPVLVKAHLQARGEACYRNQDMVRLLLVCLVTVEGIYACGRLPLVYLSPISPERHRHPDHCSSYGRRTEYASTAAFHPDANKLASSIEKIWRPVPMVNSPVSISCACVFSSASSSALISPTSASRSRSYHLWSHMRLDKVSKKIS